jgi:hypothetical protein
MGTVLATSAQLTAPVRADELIRQSGIGLRPIPGPARQQQADIPANHLERLITKNLFRCQVGGLDVATLGNGDDALHCRIENGAKTVFTDNQGPLRPPPLGQIRQQTGNQQRLDHEYRNPQDNPGAMTLPNGFLPGTGLCCSSGGLPAEYSSAVIAASRIAAAAR